MHQGVYRYKLYNGQCYILVSHPWFTYRDYWQVMLYIKHVGFIWFVFECFHLSHEPWIPWFSTLTYTCPRDEYFSHVPGIEFTIHLQSEFHEVARSESWCTFIITHQQSCVEEKYFPNGQIDCQIHSRFSGNTMFHMMNMHQP